MAKRLAVTFLLLVSLLLLASCHGSELDEKHHRLVTAHSAGARGGIGEVKVLRLPALPVVGAIPAISAIPGIPAIVP